MCYTFLQDISSDFLECVWFIREVVKREIGKWESEKREKGEKYSRFDVWFGRRER